MLPLPLRRADPACSFSGCSTAPAQDCACSASSIESQNVLEGTQKDHRVLTQGNPKIQGIPCHRLEDSTEASRVLPWGTSLSTATRYPSQLDLLFWQKAEHPANPSIQTRLLQTHCTNTLDCGTGRGRDRDLFMYLFCLLASPHSPDEIRPT